MGFRADAEARLLDPNIRGTLSFAIFSPETLSLDDACVVFFDPVGNVRKVGRVLLDAAKKYAGRTFD